jgi:hypothetical protein
MRASSSDVMRFCISSGIEVNHSPLSSIRYAAPGTFAGEGHDKARLDVDPLEGPDAAELVASRASLHEQKTDPRLVIVRDGFSGALHFAIERSARVSTVNNVIHVLSALFSRNGDLD